MLSEDKILPVGRSRKRLRIRRLASSPADKKRNKKQESKTHTFLRKLKRGLFITLFLSAAAALILGHHLTRSNAKQTTIFKDFLSSYRRHYHQIVHGKPHYCESLLDVQSLMAGVRKYTILHQEQALQRLESTLRNQTQVHSIAIVGPSGVGKTMTASALAANFPWRENVWTYAWNTHVENEVQKFRMLRLYVEQFSDCGSNLLIVDNLLPCDDAIVPLMNQMIASQDEASNKRVIVIYIFNLSAMLDSNSYQQQENTLQHLPNTTTINFKRLNKKDLRECIYREMHTENLIITKDNFDEIANTIDVATSGCKKVKAKVLVYGRPLEENATTYEG
ncbi:uncharacterized protein LOC126760580 [Bactrocera neohumeralis]|uniref:uncharacterized protein LOC126760580 n=1 Tax=Bactrocera neohumeralis TaxID=98809 RepID=UPI002165E8C2|nr:uncharacterized protein LOC126760580 [Bactrocera neohumeralis]